MEKQHPLVIVFYLDEEMMKIPEIIQPFAESINNMLAHKEANALAFFIPTKGEERVECINPTIMAEADMEKVGQLIEDIKTSFSIGVDIELEHEDVDLVPDSKPCDCGDNPDGNCDCD
jgi:hypothetical protein